MNNNKLRIFGTVNDSIVDGPGLRYTVFTQGCHHHCEGCHNLESQAIDGGYDIDNQTILHEIDENPLLEGITLSGGEPMLQAEQLIPLCKEIRKRNLNIIIYSGYTYEELINLGEPHTTLLSLCDMLVDGRFVLTKRNLSLLYRGSSNQRLINLKRTMKENQVIVYEPDEYGEIHI